MYCFHIAIIWIKLQGLLFEGEHGHSIRTVASPCFEKLWITRSSLLGIRNAKQVLLCCTCERLGFLEDRPALLLASIILACDCLFLFIVWHCALFPNLRMTANMEISNTYYQNKLRKPLFLFFYAIVISVQLTLMQWEWISFYWLHQPQNRKVTNCACKQLTRTLYILICWLKGLYTDTGFPLVDRKIPC